MHKQSRSTQIKRMVSIVVGMATLSVSLLVGALTSAAAAEETQLPAYAREAAPMVEPGVQVIERFATNDMRVREIARFGPRASGKFANPNRPMLSGCTIEFNDSDALMVQPEFARNQFVTQPWRERCGNVWSEVTGTKYNHLHLGYLANEIGLCTNWDEPFAGTYARLGTDGEGEQTCSDFDPLTEQRSSPRSHIGTEVVRFRMYDIDGYQPFRLNQIRVKDQAIRLCAQPIDAEAGIVIGEAQDGEMSGASCWNLDPGLWNLSNYTDNTGTVTMTGAAGSIGSFSFDDINITDQS